MSHGAWAKADRSLDGVGKLPPDEAAREADVIIKNTYRTLMTRGMKGCYVYCTDPALREHLRWKAAPYALEYGTGGE